MGKIRIVNIRIRCKPAKSPNGKDVVRHNFHCKLLSDMKDLMIKSSLNTRSRKVWRSKFLKEYVTEQ